MVKQEWGTKRTCTTCGARFYDLNKTPIICPKCGAENDKDVVKVKRGTKAAAKKVSAKAAIIDDEVDDDLDTALVDDEDEDKDLMEDASDLGEDDEDMAEVIEHIEPGDKDE